MSRFFSLRGLAAVCAGGALAFCEPSWLAYAEDAKAPEAQKALSTLDNLMTAFNGESNAHVRYLAFAKKADEEGYGPVASLFRAAARAEEIHAANHAKAILGLGGQAKADLKTPEVKSTKENLEAAIKGENYERDTMYPDFLAQAKQDKLTAAIRTFRQAQTAEAEHARLYTEASQNLDAWKGAKKTFYVCPVCGYTVAKVDFTDCPSCSAPGDKYEAIS